MERFYSEELLNDQLAPLNSTVSFLLNYSKSIKVVRNRNEKPIMFHLN